jgi:hypothetical protein
MCVDNVDATLPNQVYKESNVSPALRVPALADGMGDVGTAKREMECIRYKDHLVPGAELRVAERDGVRFGSRNFKL